MPYTLKEEKSKYNTLKREANEYYDKIDKRKKILMWMYPKDKLESMWSIKDLWDRTSAAQSLGWDVIIESSAEGIKVYYVEKLPSTKPFSFW